MTSAPTVKDVELKQTASLAFITFPARVFNVPRNFTINEIRLCY
jgi:hypothetical protein